MANQLRQQIEQIPKAVHLRGVNLVELWNSEVLDPLIREYAGTVH